MILAGGKGSRIKNYLKGKPKPMAKIGKYTFLDLLIGNIAKCNFRKIYILAGYKGSQIYKKYHKKIVNLTPIECIVEKKPLGTGGGLSALKKKISKNFFIFNGDTIFDFNYFEMFKLKKNYNQVIAIKKSNFKIVGNKIKNISILRDCTLNIAIKKNKNIYTNGGVYLFDKSIFKIISKNKISLEDDIIYELIIKKKISGYISKSFFYDIGTKNDYKAAEKNLLGYLKKPALFIDRDNTINKDNGYTYKYKDFKFINNSFEALRHVTKKKIYIFIISNQGGIAKGFFTEKDFFVLHKKLKKKFLKNNIIVNEVKYCPYHPKATILKYRKSTKLRKPGNLMIKQILDSWVVDINKSVMIGDSIKDKNCAEKSSLDFFYVTNNLKNQLESIRSLN